MNPAQFEAELKRKTEALKKYAAKEMPRMAGAKILRFINGNFRAQGWQGKTFEPWAPIRRKGTILVKKGRLRRSFKTQTIGDGMVRTWSTAPYAKAHNNGFNGTVNIPAHTRRKFTASKVGTGKFTKSGKERQKTIHTVTGQSQVKAHERKVRIIRRQFMPTDTSGSPVLIKAIKREVVKSIKQIFQ